MILAAACGDRDSSRFSKNPPHSLSGEKSMTRLSRVGLALLGALCLQTGFAQTDANLGRNLASTCANCHGTNGAARGEMKAIAGLPAVAIEGLMAGYKSGAITGTTIMHQIAKGYSDEQIKLIAAYLAAQPRK
jgi:cytochrome subunit of sulfide dehydrogenase